MVANSNDNVLIYVVNVRIHLSIMHNQYTYINVYVCVYTRLFCLWNFPGKNTRAGCHSLFQEISPTQGSNLGLLDCRQILYHLSHQGNPKIKEGNAYCQRSNHFTLTPRRQYSQRQFSSVQLLSCPTLCDPMNRSTPGLSVHHHLLEFTQSCVHRVSDAIQPSHPRSSPSPPAPNPSQHQSLLQ